MHIYHLSDTTIDGYLRDVIERLQTMPAPPDLLCAVTLSGLELLKRLMFLAGSMGADKVTSCRIASIGKQADHDLSLRGLDLETVAGSRCFLLDSAVHSGRLMTRAHALLCQHGAREISSYALVLKSGSQHIPTFWSLMIADVDRALFGMSSIPNNRLSSGRSTEQKALTISLLDARHSALPPVLTGLQSMDRATWSDRYFDMQASGHESRTYVLEQGPTVIGYLTQHLSRGGRHLHVDEVALSNECQGQRIGGVLLRFAMTYARHHDCTRVRLHALQQRTGFYQSHGFALVPGKTPLRLDDESYILMEKAILHEPDDGVDQEA